MASPRTSTNSPDLFLQVGNLTKEVSRLTSKLHKVGLTLAEADWLEFNRLLLERVLLLNHLAEHHHNNQRAPSPRFTSPLHTAPKKPQRSKKRFADRACRHCGTATTSQWRTGPLGPSTCVASLHWAWLRFCLGFPSRVFGSAPSHDEVIRSH